jgi:hypothetical protein
MTLYLPPFIATPYMLERDRETMRNCLRVFVVAMAIWAILISVAFWSGAF